MDPRRDDIYNFIINVFNIDWYQNQRENEVFEEQFPSYQIFQAYQRRIINSLDEANLIFAMYLKAYIQQDMIDVMDKEGMEPIGSKGFYYLNGSLTIAANQ
jgi:hypothetical protein